MRRRWAKSRPEPPFSFRSQWIAGVRPHTSPCAQPRTCSRDWSCFTIRLLWEMLRGWRLAPSRAMLVLAFTNGSGASLETTPPSHEIACQNSFRSFVPRANN
ncbi:hypothetical protein BU24DRAFT_225849 [Aaosphaeria arxii CBS 175.79]|uniref:Uncharacterized protein n=1 Tax=Aaosphaeria arxii CBS 175.79 TaxID=1450172 RepID=A0A6A5XPX9_9PLEO|nr:uncharacterized protein BU24DRAFT_225849 [Aaosphaeria arxii CBS 175.79]KAF2014966.1 hypothetical protein BU24DRAFT_225849 [Aaosphaeria arxii CBS 175.79]